MVDTRMNITVAVGNPPYQDEGGSGGTNDELYKKYGITPKEETYIESMVKAME